MSILRAWRYMASVDLLSVDSLVSCGIRCVLLDRDNTVVPCDTKTPPAEVRAWLDELKAAGISCCMVSNNFHAKQVQKSARELDVPAIDHAMKPFPFAIRRALDMLGARPEEAIMVGDQVFTDVVSGRLAGVRTVLVRPQSSQDFLHTYVLRAFENLAVKGKVFEGE